MIYGISGRSTAQKLVVIAAQTVVLAGAIWMLEFGGLGVISRLLHLSWARASSGRRALLTVALCIVYLRIIVTVFYLLKRSIGWQEAASIPAAFMLYFWGFPLFAGPTAGSIGAVEYVGVALFLVGSFLNTGSELLRDGWKRDPAHKGKLYTGGLFRYSMHINYFGDVVWVAGLAFVTANPWSAIVPVLLFVFFAFYNAPMLDNHLAEKYGTDFAEYRAKTKKIVPFLF